MKLLVKSDDFGFTRGVTDGTVDGIQNGIITCTGLFTNMSASSYAAEKIKECGDICLGVDINIVSGPSVSGPELLPTLTDENGEFIRSTVKYADPRYVRGGENEELWPYEECYIETKAQMERFLSLVGRKPEYICGHSITHNAGSYVRAIRKVSEEYGVPFSVDMLEKNHVTKIPNCNKKPFGIDEQLKADVEGFTLQQLELLQGEEYAWLGGHCGFLDEELLKYSTFSVIRVKDHKMYTSKRIQKWLSDHQVELISFKDLPNI